MAAEKTPRPPARERILDAAAEVMRRDGLAHATTKQIAHQADCSEALLYKHFPDKKDIFLSVLGERSAGLTFTPEHAGTGSVKENLVQLTVQLMEFYRENFPMAASIFGSRDLLVSHREGMQQRGAGPWAPKDVVKNYLEAEARLGRIHADGSVLDAAATLLTGGALHEAFLAAYADQPLNAVNETAQALVNALDHHLV
ncbi:TetR/AcrR family transcriptional regulator [Nesterenkonia sp. MY13]|uniref:TetR/AcrR family transcriptional regulator n=1 Tax=Nesterenkonia sedimenti TaxID=1463632 RepID=A0A7X8TI56_9MICC|nr:TetR/AcrR family transcriptional regulator [Nesterenkonia sedimenti]NLS08488.1 TetR/AcrR family transcriptional regulator [Nesterenkonia sedimenti]